jgi:hypothetical protein
MKGKNLRYIVNKTQIRSENAAKSPVQYSKYLKNWILQYDKVGLSVDYGCGKLRYANHLRKISKHTVLVDSKIQLTRTQTLFGINTSVRDYVKKNWKTCEVQYAETFSENNVADFILCANVLSAIPSLYARTKMLSKIESCLKPKGQCLFCTQYTNSYFTMIAQSQKSKKHLDGWIFQSRNGAYYYGIINCKKMRAILEKIFSIIDVWREGQSTYALVQK